MANRRRNINRYRRYKKRVCPGCGEEIKLPPQTLCDDCQDMMRLAKREKQRRQAGDEGEILVAVGRHIPHGKGTLWVKGEGLPGYEGKDRRFASISITESDMIRLILELMGAEPKDVDLFETEKWIYVKDCGMDSAYVMKTSMTPTQANLLELILGYIGRVADESYARGYNRAKGLLQSMIKGELDIQQVNKFQSEVN